MKLLAGFANIVGVLISLCVWGLVPDLLWDHGYKLFAAIAFVFIPFCLLHLTPFLGRITEKLA